MFEEGHKSGPGVLKGRNTYRGIFKNGQSHFFGVEYSENGDVYEGCFYEGKREGTGRFETSDGSRYLGGFKNSLKSGYGKLEQGKMLYVGGFKENKKEKLGFLRESNRDTYFGEFFDDNKEGYGYEVTSHDEYKGEWAYGLRHGIGILKRKNSEFFSVKYIEGRRVDDNEYYEMYDGAEDMELDDDYEVFHKMFNRTKIDNFFGVSQTRFDDMEIEIKQKRGDLEVELGYLPLDLVAKSSNLEEKIKF